MARVIQVIEVEIKRGNGQDDPIRGVMQYFDFDGKLLAEHDPCPNACPCRIKITG